MWTMPTETFLRSFLRLTLDDLAIFSPKISTMGSRAALQVLHP
jgi:hypothetical protein